MNELLENLNPEQLKPVEDTEGPVLVLAGAGSGKTRVLTTRIAYLIEEKGVSPFNILAITFTNKAAKEMAERIQGLTDAYGMWISTIHSMCTRILRKDAERLGFNDKFSIYSESERSTVLKKSFKECDYDDEKLFKNCKWHVSNAKMLGLEPEAYTVYQSRHGENTKDLDVVENVYRRYQTHLRENNAMDFDDLLMLTHRLLKENEDVRAYYAGKFQYILVDEFQDTNSVQFEIIRMLASVHNNLFAVGDDDQSIYGWRGADINNILSFERNFPGAKVYKLEQNYRSTKTILSLANTVIHNNRNRKDKTLWTENGEGAKPVVFEAEEESEEALFTAATISKMVKAGEKFSSFAVLMRINALTRAYEQEFAKYSIPYKVFGGFKFFERKEIKDLLAYLRIINNPFDSEAVVRIINFPKRGIGDKTIEVLENYASENDLTVYDALLDLDSLGLNSGVKAKLKAFASLLKNLVLRGQELTIDLLVKEVIEKTQMREAYADNSDESITKRANIDEFQNSVDEFVRLNPNANLEDYLNQVALSSDVDEMDDTNYVTLATVHAVKGLEFPCVFLCGLEEGRFPVSSAENDEDDMEEERRLMYVAITRAREKIYFTRSKSRYLYGKREPAARSCFLKELAPLLSLPDDRPAFKRFQGDYYDDDSGYGYSRYGRSSYGGGYGSNYGSSYGSSYGSNYGGSYGSGYSSRSYAEDDSAFKTYGSGRAQNSGMGGPNGGEKKSENSFSFAKKMASQQSASASGGDKSALLVAGTKVYHPKFGHGIVLSYRGAADNAILKVGFEQFGVKELSARLAPLTIEK
jgi:DNA helicase-2/ATP-dependent DNA helicase PcrA